MSTPDRRPEPPTPPAGVGRRAPRLSPEDRIASHVTRVGRFRRIDPGRGRPLPGMVRLLGVLGWAVLLGESFRRALAARAR